MKKKFSSDLTRLNKYISQSGLCSRRSADKLILNGKVKVNNKICQELGTKVSIGDKVIVDNKLIKPEKNIYILLNKPKDYITTNKDTHNRKIVFDLIKGVNERLFSVGRLDRKTTGLLLLTNDGNIAKKLTHPSYRIKKIYSVTLEKNISEIEINQIRKGIIIDGELIKVDRINRLVKNNELGVEIHIGKNRIVRKIFESINHKVSKLDRVLFGPLTKKDLPRGKWRKLKEQEIRNLKIFTK
ncbi:MAG: pseudouridine synthase [Flammeovirgaceae bacterium]